MAFCDTMHLSRHRFMVVMNREDFTDEEWESLRNAVKLYLEEGGEVACPGQRPGWIVDWKEINIRKNHWL